MTMETPSFSEVLSCSPFVERALQAMCASKDEQANEWTRLLEKEWSREDLSQRVSSLEDSDALRLGLRTLRRELIVSLIAQNSTHRIGYEDVVRIMSDFAELSVSQTVSVYARELSQQFGIPMNAQGIPQDLIVVGMGKLGGRELNVSSDIDLVFLYDEDGETQTTPVCPHARRNVSVYEFYERLSRRIIPALNDIEGPGFVFRVDMRLRPNGESGPIVCSSGMLEEYLYAQGRDWERFAWLKGRVVNQSVFTTPEQFRSQVKTVDDLVRPFVYRKYLDFGALESLRKLHELIRAETSRRERSRGEHSVNVKLGRGGIREIEFLTQTMQVIRGGRDPQLRGRSTLSMLALLGQEGILPNETAKRCQEDYIFLRNLEHAIQYVNDEQSQLLNVDSEQMTKVAGLLGVPPQSLWEHLQTVRNRVAVAFDGIFQVHEPQSNNADWPLGWETGTPSTREAVLAHLSRLGYGEASEEIWDRLLRLVGGKWTSGMSDTSRERMQRLLPVIVDGCPHWRNPHSVRSASAAEVLSRYLRLLETIAGRSTYVSLLFEYPKAAERVGHVLAASRWTADFLSRHPIILDELVAHREKGFDDFTPVNWRPWAERLHRELMSATGDQERQMNILRDEHHAALFQLLIADLDGRFSVERLADQLSALADAVLQQIIDLAWHSLTSRHCEQPKFAVIGYGKLGGKELSYDSDLDLVFIYDDDAPEAEQNYMRLVRRMMSWLTLQTSSGKLFDVDLRLRPNGESGLIVTPFKMFCRYQDNADGTGAWFWEHQALTRARFVAGDLDLGAAFEKQREQVLIKKRQPDQTREEVLAMREKMHQGHLNRSKWFDLKHDRGGMVDVEFIVQWCVLTYSHQYPELVNNFGNILLLEKVANLGLLPQPLTSEVVKAYRHYRQLQHEIRLNMGESSPARVAPESVAQERTSVMRLWQWVFGEKLEQAKSSLSSVERSNI